RPGARVPSGLNATPESAKVWAAEGEQPLPERMFQGLAVVSSPAVARLLPSGLKATVSTVPLWAAVCGPDPRRAVGGACRSGCSAPDPYALASRSATD